MIRWKPHRQLQSVAPGVFACTSEMLQSDEARGNVWLLTCVAVQTEISDCSGSCESCEVLVTCLKLVSDKT